jgi:hypothetical protein
MCLLVFGTPGANDIADVCALVLYLGVVAHCICTEGTAREALCSS